MITTQQLLDAFKDCNMSVQMLSVGAGRDRVACTAGTVSLDNIVKAMNLALDKAAVRTEAELEIIEAARNKWAAPADDEIAIYDDAIVSEADGGVWVGASVYMRDGSY